MTGLADGSQDQDTVDMKGLGVPDADRTTVYTNFTPPGYSRDMILSRDVSSEDVETQKLDVMPGFRLSWWYSGAEVTPDNNYKDEDMTKQFVR